MNTCSAELPDMTGISDQTNNFAAVFEQNSERSDGLDLGSCIGQPYRFPCQLSLPVFRLLSFGTVKAASTYRMTAHSLDCALLLRTCTGHGSLHIGKQVIPLQDSGSNLLLLDCRQPFQLSALSADWEFQVFYFTGPSVFEYLQQFPDHWGTAECIPRSCSLSECLGRLFQAAQHTSVNAAINISGLLYQILINCLSAAYPEEQPPQFPEYLTQIRDLFDQNYQNFYSLDDLSLQFQISKYRLCREFHACFGTSPIQYLNLRRINAARLLLTDSRYKVYEIGSLVGIDNTNHFISLFKRFTGMTPEQYRQEKRNQF